MSHKPKRLENGRGIPRREFGRLVALASASAAVPAKAVTRGGGSTSTQATPSQPPPMSATAEAQVQAIFGKYGDRLSEEQKADIRRLIAQAQKTSEALRAFALENSAEPATVFHVYHAGRR